AAARTALVTLQKLHRAGVWQSYHALLQDQSGFRSHVSRCDFAAAAQSVAEFATTADTEEATARAKGLAEWAQQADQFAKALELACAAGSVQLTSDEEG